MSDAVLTEVSDGIAVITINRPDARNAVNGEVARGIAAAIEEFDSGSDVRVLVLTEAGGTFSAGMDLKGFLSGDVPTAGDRGFGGITQRPPVKTGHRGGGIYVSAAHQFWHRESQQAFPRKQCTRLDRS